MHGNNLGLWCLHAELLWVTPTCSSCSGCSFSLYSVHVSDGIVHRKCSSYHHIPLCKWFPEATEGSSKLLAMQTRTSGMQCLPYLFWSHPQHFQLRILCSSYANTPKVFPRYHCNLLSALPVLFVLPKGSFFLLANSHSSSNTDLRPYLFRNWPCTLDQVPFCVLKALHAYICTSNPAFVMT